MWPIDKNTEIFQKKLIITQLPNKTIKLTDLGIFNRKRSPEKFVQFVMRPYLIKKYGLVKIEKIKLKKPSTKSFRAINELRNTFEVGEICYLTRGYK
jgi:hypothetical protein